MAPEQARGKPVDGRTDVYALGVLAYKMLTGAMPFRADNAMDLIVMHLKAPPPAPHKLARDTPIELSRLVQRMMAKDPAERPTIAEIREVFATLRGTGRAQAAPPPRRRLTAALVGMALFFAGVIAVATIWFVQQQGTSTQPGDGMQAPPAATGAAAGADGDPEGSQSSAESGSAGEEPMIEFEPDPVAREQKLKTSRARSSEREPEPEAEQAAQADAELDLPVANRPGTLLLVLETASSIEIDGAVVAQSSKGGRFEISPGQHHIRVKAPGRQPVERTFEVEPGGTALIRVADDPEAP